MAEHPALQRAIDELERVRRGCVHRAPELTAYGINTALVYLRLVTEVPPAALVEAARVLRRYFDQHPSSSASELTTHLRALFDALPPEPAEPVIDEAEVEAVARAITEAMGMRPDDCFTGSASLNTDGASKSECHVRQWQLRTSQARAAIAALARHRETKS